MIYNNQSIIIGDVVYLIKLHMYCIYGFAMVTKAVVYAWAQMENEIIRTVDG